MVPGIINVSKGETHPKKKREGRSIPVVYPTILSVQYPHHKLNYLCHGGNHLDRKDETHLVQKNIKFFSSVCPKGTFELVTSA